MMKYKREQIEDLKYMLIEYCLNIRKCSISIQEAIDVVDYIFDKWLKKCDELPTKLINKKEE